MDIGLGDLYSERALAAGVTTEKADLIFASLPYRILHTFQIPAYEQMAEQDKDFYDRLEQAGFRHDWGDDGSGLFMKYLRRGSGYYIDVGAADLVANGDVKLAQGQIDHLTEDAAVLEDGTTLPADVVVFATGYNSMNGWVADLIDQETADRLGKCWGLGSETTKDPGPWEGEQRNMWKPTQVPHLWMHGGNLHQSRHYSLYLALQLKARHEGIDTPVYGLAGGAPHRLTLGTPARRPAGQAWTGLQNTATAMLATVSSSSPHPQALRDAGLAGVGHHQHQDHQADGELHADLDPVDVAVARLQHADEQQAGEEGGARAVAHRGVHPLLRFPRLGEQPAEERGEAQDVHEQQDQPGELHAGTLASGRPRHFFVRRWPAGRRAPGRARSAGPAAPCCRPAPCR